MKEATLIRQNLMDNVNYRPYCGGEKDCYMPRTEWTGEQFICPNCKWRSGFPISFIKRYKSKHKLK